VLPGTNLTDQQIHDDLVQLVTLLLVGYGLWLLVKVLGRSRPGLMIGTPIAVAFIVRVMASWAVGSTSFASSLRGGDETFFLEDAHGIAQTAFGGAEWTHALFNELFKFVFAGQILAFDSPDQALRITQAGIAVAGLVLLAVAVYELAGSRAAVVAAWLLAFEPASVFFSTLLHKEPNMMLAEGLVAFGGAAMWKRADLRYLLPITLGCLIAVATRPYAGWFLIAAGAAITLHAGLRSRRESGAGSLVLVAVVVLFGAIAAPTVWKASTHQNLQRNVQQSQNANASDDANLSLERVDFSTRGAIIVNLPQRIKDVLFRPYPWQLGNTSQQLGLLGTIVALVLLWILIRELWRSRGQIMARAGPLIYTGFFLLIAYSLSAGNAGTAFRYRTHIVAVAICLAVVLKFARERESAALRERVEAGSGELPMAETGLVSA